MNRETGYYWCKNTISAWFVAYYYDGQWIDEDGRVEFLESDIDQINETRILNPDER